MSTKKRIGWIVDVQNDFMDPPEQGGRLYVHNLFDESDPGARQVRQRITEAVAWMHENCDTLVFTGDWHSYDDAEIDPVSPDPAKGTYLPHCMGMSDDPSERRGAEIIPEIAPEFYVPLGRDTNPEEARRIAGLAVRCGVPVFVKKNVFDVFQGNPGAEAFLAALQEELGGNVEIILCGVATDVCVTNAVDGMQQRGYNVNVLQDAIWGLGLEPDEAIFDRWCQRGRLTTLDQLQG